jgi:ribonuclease VapC
LTAGSHISVVNWAEVLSKLTELGQDPNQVAQDLEDRGILGSALIVHPADESLAMRIAELRPLTKFKGLSLGDRACLALASQLQLGVLTAERNWRELDVGVEIRLIRHQEPKS